MERRRLAEVLGAGAGADQAAHRLVCEGEPAAFMSAFAGAAAGVGDVFLGNPKWRPSETAAAKHLQSQGGASGEKGWLMVPTGGSGGSIRFARHDGWTIEAAVRGFCAHFGMERVNSVGVLPLHHVSGLMAWMRSAVTGGRFIPWPWKAAAEGRFPSVAGGDFCLSLVPTQLQRLVRSAEAVRWMRSLRVVFVGGGAMWEDLIEESARLGLPLSPCYGATETAAMVAAIRPADFLAGSRGCGTPLPHARIDAVDGLLRVAGESVFRGYYPEMLDGRSWTTGDRGSVGPNGNVTVLGRSDDVIVTGGEKVSASEVEAALRASGQFDDVVVIGILDGEWGQRVVACHPASRPPSMELVRAALSGLAPFKHPKSYAAVDPWPRNEQGKISRAELARQAALGGRPSA